MVREAWLQAMLVHLPSERRWQIIWLNRYILRCPKKAKRGIATPKQEIDLVKHRLKAAEQHYTKTYGEE